MPSSIATTLISAARAGADVLRSYFARSLVPGVMQKGPADFVSEADLQSETVIRRVLGAAYPDVRFQAEETDVDRASTGPRFIIDPLDGTTNFLREIPHFSISLAYADDTGTVAGVVLDPMRDELFWAERGVGAFLGERRLRVSSLTSLEAALIHTGIPHRGAADHARYLSRLSRVMASVVGIRRMGSAALDLSYVAAGRGDAFFERGLKPWDLAAGMLLVCEAGGVVTDQDGGERMVERGEVLAASSALHALVLRTLNGP
ncbi:MAG TPA: inositol monophosphatase family protein [Polyangiaceae bacterium]|nr:inositol monophosphatase family protein [Polyangiaceae bacterium]